MDVCGKLFFLIEVDIDLDVLMDESVGGGEVEVEVGEFW